MTMEKFDRTRFDLSQNSWRGCKVLIVGAGRQGLASARYLAGHGAEVTVNDRQSPEALQEAQKSLSDLSVRWVVGGHPIEILEGIDLVCVSGGVPLTLPLLKKAQVRGIPLTNDSQIFLQATPATVIGITGSAGKTTTTTLVGRIALASLHSQQQTRFRQVWVGGNIGNPLIADVNEMRPNDLVVMELSSFQLELMSRSPQIAAILNITPNHLDRHGTMEAYTEAKARILAFQGEADTAILNREDSGSWGLKERVCGRLVTFGVSFAKDFPGTYFDEGKIMYWDSQSSSSLLNRESIGLRGDHNLCNVLAACAIALSAGLPPEAIRQGVEGFTGVEHRLEYVRTVRGAKWYNDSIATAPERTMAAIRSFDEPITLLAGGRDKNLPWKEFAQMAIPRVRQFILFGEAAEKIERTLREVAGEKEIRLTRCDTLFEAVQKAAQLAEAGDVVLLSPGGTSFDEFKDFEERGECFRKWVMNL